MEKYLGVKLIEAELQDKIAVSADDETKELCGTTTTLEGYKVVYEDGYTSWSPKDVFEGAYRQVFDMFSTIPDLSSDIPEYQQRVFGEAVELKSKCMSLNKFIESANIFKTLPTKEQTRLKQQLMAMQYYLTILVERSNNF